MIENAMLEVLKQVPALAVLAWLTTKFLDGLAKRDAMLQSLTAEFREAHNRSIEAVNRNSVALGRVEGALDSQRQQIVDSVQDGFDRIDSRPDKPIPH